MSRASSFFTTEPHALGGTHDAAASSDEEEEGFNDPGLEQMITLVGDVKNRTVFIIDDMIDKAGSWIAAAETVTNWAIFAATHTVPLAMSAMKPAAVVTMAIVIFTVYVPGKTLGPWVASNAAVAAGGTCGAFRRMGHSTRLMPRRLFGGSVSTSFPCESKISSFIFPKIWRLLW